MEAKHTAPAVPDERPSVMVPEDVLQAVERISNPLHESRLTGVTAQEDARCMKVISDFIKSLAAAPSAPSVSVDSLDANAGGQGDAASEKERLLARFPTARAKDVSSNSMPWWVIYLDNSSNNLAGDGPTEGAAWRNAFAFIECENHRPPAQPKSAALTEALRQYQHNDCSGIVIGYDKAIVDRLFAQQAKDVERYRWLRGQHWNASTLFVVAGHHSLVRLGTECPSGELLDAAIDAAITKASA